MVQKHKFSTSDRYEYSPFEHAQGRENKQKLNKTKIYTSLQYKNIFIQAKGEKITST